MTTMYAALKTRSHPKTRTALAAVAVAAVALGTAACTPGDNGTTGDSGNPAITVVVGMKGLAFYDAMECGALAAGEEFGANVTVDGPQDFDPTQQQTVLQAMLVNQPDGLAVVPDDPNALNVTLSEQAAKIPVVTMDGTLSEEIGLVSYRSNAFDGGAVAADYMAELLGGEGVVQAIGINPTFETNVQRVSGFVDRMKEAYPGITVLEVQYGGGDVSGASTVVSGILQSHPDLAGVYVPYEAGAAGAAQAIASAPNSADIKLIGFDSSPAQIEALQAGTFAALVLQDPYGMGYEAVKLLTKVIADPSAADGLEFDQYTQTMLATPDNMNNADVAKLLTPPTC